MEYLSDERMRWSLYLTSVFTFLVSLAQISEFMPLIKQQKTLSELTIAYFKDTALHPLFCILIILVFLYIQFHILEEERPLTLLLNFFFIIVLSQAVWKNRAVVYSFIGELTGFRNEEIHYLSIFILVLFFSTLIIKKRPKNYGNVKRYLSQFFRKLKMLVKKRF